MVKDANSDGLPNYNDTITFNVSTGDTDRPYVSLNCYIGSNWVYSGSVGYFPDYPWAKEFVLATQNSWTSGAADCTATLYKTTDGTRSTTLAILNFHVNP